MFYINHNDAINLEHQVRRLYSCDRAGVFGLVDADNFEKYPIQAAVLVVAFIYAKELETDSYQYSDFLYKYQLIFTYPDENNAAKEVKNYIKELTEIVDKYI